MVLDKIDYHLLNILQNEAKITNVVLAKKVGLSPSATLDRVKKLENLGIITKYCTQIDTSKLGYMVEAVILVRLKRATTENILTFQEAIYKINAIVCCYQIIGDFHFLLLSKSKDNNQLQREVMEKLYAISLVDLAKIHLVTQRLKDHTIALQ